MNRLWKSFKAAIWLYENSDWADTRQKYNALRAYLKTVTPVTLW